jgi:dipeptidyl aminopeptidase/acylaminoacyl peptidase
MVRYEAGRRSAVCLAVRGQEPHCLEPGEPINGLVLGAGGKSVLYAAESAIWQLDIRGDRLGRATRILDGAFPDLTADRQGKRLAFTKSYSDPNLWRITPGAQKVEKLIASSGEDTNADYSPDGEAIAFTSTRSGYSELYIGGKAGLGARQLTSLSGVVANAQWSADGRWIAFTALTDDTQHANVYIIPAGGGAPQRITDDQSPRWRRPGRVTDVRSTTPKAG